MRLRISASWPLILALFTTISTAVALPTNGTGSDQNVTNSTNRALRHDTVDCFGPSSRAISQDCYTGWTKYVRGLSGILSDYTITKWPLSPSAIRVPKTIKYGRCTIKMGLQKFTPDLDDVTKEMLNTWGSETTDRCFGRRSAAAGALFTHEFNGPGFVVVELKNIFTLSFTLAPEDITGNNTSSEYEVIDDSTETVPALYSHETGTVASS